MVNKPLIRPYFWAGGTLGGGGGRLTSHKHETLPLNFLNGHHKTTLTFQVFFNIQKDGEPTALMVSIG